MTPIPALVEGVDVDAVMFVFLKDLLGVIISIEGVHEHQRNICVECLV